MPAKLMFTLRPLSVYRQRAYNFVYATLEFTSTFVRRFPWNARLRGYYASQIQLQAAAAIVPRQRDPDNRSGIVHVGTTGARPDFCETSRLHSNPALVGVQLTVGWQQRLSYLASQQAAPSTRPLQAAPCNSLARSRNNTTGRV